MTAIALVAPDISCEHCKRSIEQDLAEVPGVHGVVVDVETKVVRVNYDDSQTGDQALRAKLADIGYPTD